MGNNIGNFVSKETQTNFANNIKTLIRTNNYSNAKLSQTTGITTDSIKKYKEGVMPDPISFDVLSEALGVTKRELLGPLPSQGNNIYGDTLKYYIYINSYTPKEFAQAVKISLDELNKMCQGKSDIKMTYKESFSSVLHLTGEEFEKLIKSSGLTLDKNRNDEIIKSINIATQIQRQTASEGYTSRVIAQKTNLSISVIEGLIQCQISEAAVRAVSNFIKKPLETFYQITLNSYDERNDFGYLLQKLLYQNRFNAASFAKRLDIEYARMKQILCGYEKPSDAELSSIAKELKVNKQELAVLSEQVPLITQDYKNVYLNLRLAVAQCDKSRNDIAVQDFDTTVYKFNKLLEGKIEYNEFLSKILTFTQKTEEELQTPIDIKIVEQAESDKTKRQFIRNAEITNMKKQKKNEAQLKQADSEPKEPKQAEAKTVKKADATDKKTQEVVSNKNNHQNPKKDKTIAACIRRRMMEEKLTYADMSDILNVNQNTIAGWIHVNSFREDYLAKIADFLEVDVAYLKSLNGSVRPCEEDTQSTTKAQSEKTKDNTQKKDNIINLDDIEDIFSPVAKETSSGEKTKDNTDALIARLEKTVNEHKATIDKVTETNNLLVTKNNTLVKTVSEYEQKNKDLVAKVDELSQQNKQLIANNQKLSEQLEAQQKKQSDTNSKTVSTVNMDYSFNEDMAVQIDSILTNLMPLSYSEQILIMKMITNLFPASKESNAREQLSNPMCLYDSNLGQYMRTRVLIDVYMDADDSTKNIILSMLGRSLS